MPRPRKCCRVAFLPGVTYFKPARIPLRDLKQVLLSLEEAEALRLKDLEGLEQEEGARRMEISRPTFQRMLTAARRKIAEALLNGKAIRIEAARTGEPERFRCSNGHEWIATRELAMAGRPEICPTCKAASVGGQE